MEMAVNLKSMRLSWVFVILATFGWVVYEYAENSVFYAVPFIIVCIQTIIFFGARQIMLHAMTGSGEE